MKTPKLGKDRVADTYDLNIKNLDERLSFQEFDESILSKNNLFISTLAMDFHYTTSMKKRKEIEEVWKNNLPRLTHVKSLILRHRVDQEYFEAICEMVNLESLVIITSKILDVSSISKLKKIKLLTLSNFSQLEDISPLIELKSLECLSILASFKISNYNLIGQMKWLKSLEIGGDANAPRNLMLDSLKPFSKLNELLELNLFSASIRDKDYRPILELKKLLRLDAHWRMKNEEREFIQNEHQSLRSGFFVAYDFVAQKFKEGIEW